MLRLSPTLAIGKTAFSVPPTTIGTQTNTDDFNRANQDPLAGNWTSQTVTTLRLELLTNRIQCEGTTDDGDAFWTTWTADNQYSQIEVTSNVTSAGAGFGVLARCANSASTRTYYRLVINGNGGYELSRFNTGTKTTLRSGTTTYVAGAKLGCSVTGGATSTLKIWYNGAQVGSDVTDTSALTTGKPGVSYSSGETGDTTFGDNWDAGTVP